MSFIEKYKPQNYDEIIGNNKKYKELEKQMIKDPKKKYLILGKSNLCKSTFIDIFSKKNKYKIISIDIEKIDDIDIDIFTYNVFIKKLILIDDIKLTNLSYKDKAKKMKKIKKLINIINSVTNTLIIIIGDKNIKEYKKIKDVSINTIRMYKIDYLQKHIKMIFDKEKIKYSETTYMKLIDNIIENSNKNIKKIYLNIETFLLNNKKTLRFNEKTRDKIKKTKKDNFVNDTFDLLNQSFKEYDINNREDLMDRESFYYNEPFIVGGNIRENYIKLSSYKKNPLEKIDIISESLSDGDIISLQVNTKKDYSISMYQTYLNFIIPTYYLQGKYKTFFNFPSIIGKDNKVMNSSKKIEKIKKENISYFNYNNEDIIYIRDMKLL